jgi:hypothetical protein
VARNLKFSVFLGERVFGLRKNVRQQTPDFFGAPIAFSRGMDVGSRKEKCVKTKE